MKRLVLVTLVSLVGITGCKSTKSDAPAPNKPPAPAVTETQPGSAAAAAADPWHKPEGAKDPLKHPLLWSAEKDGTTTYFLGTMHMGIDAEARLPKAVWDRFDAAPTFAMETDLGDPAAAKLGERSSGTLRDDLGPDYWKKLEAQLTPAIASAVADKKPMIAAMMLSLKHLPPTPPMDGVLHGRAINQKKKVVFLEPVSAQGAILEKHLDVRALKMILDTPEKGAKQAKQMLDAYLAGDVDAILAINDQARADALAYGYTEKEYAEQMEDLLYRRNANWIAPLEKLHASGGGFVAVGALHLVGPRSVLDLLEKKGYKITRIEP